jgi:hypothetical protein
VLLGEYGMPDTERGERIEELQERLAELRRFL